MGTLTNGLGLTAQWFASIPNVVANAAQPTTDPFKRTSFDKELDAIREATGSQRPIYLVRYPAMAAEWLSAIPGDVREAARAVSPLTGDTSEGKALAEEIRNKRVAKEQELFGSNTPEPPTA